MTCAGCGGPLPAGAGSSSACCSDLCRARVARLERQATRVIEQAAQEALAAAYAEEEDPWGGT